MKCYLCIWPMDVHFEGNTIRLCSEVGYSLTPKYKARMERLAGDGTLVLHLSPKLG
jgi:hypothetical protein